MSMSYLHKIREAEGSFCERKPLVLQTCRQGIFSCQRNVEKRRHSYKNIFLTFGNNTKLNATYGGGFLEEKADPGYSLKGITMGDHCFKLPLAVVSNSTY